MTRIILCEGETDLVLISYYLGKACGWTYTKKPKRIKIKLDFPEQDNRSACVYHNESGEELLICAVGGKDNFGNFFHEFLEQPIHLSNAGETEYRIALVTDRDDLSTVEIEAAVTEQLSPMVSRTSNNQWVLNEADIDFGEKAQINFLLVAIPRENAGALETLLLESLADDDCKTSIIEKSGAFVGTMKESAHRYIGTSRLQLKAHLGVVLSILNPEKIFSLFEEHFLSIKWEESEVIVQCFERLIEI